MAKRAFPRQFSTKSNFLFKSNFIQKGLNFFYYTFAHDDKVLDDNRLNIKNSGDRLE